MEWNFDPSMTRSSLAYLLNLSILDKGIKYRTVTGMFLIPMIDIFYEEMSKETDILTYNILLNSIEDFINFISSIIDVAINICDDEDPNNKDNVKELASSYLNGYDINENNIDKYIDMLFIIIRNILSLIPEDYKNINTVDHDNLPDKFYTFDKVYNAYVKDKYIFEIRIIYCTRLL